MPPAHQGRRGSRSRTVQDRFDLAVESSARNRRRDSGPRWPWPVVCILCCLLGVLGVWVLLTGLVVPEWLALPRGNFGALVSGSTQLWLLAQGVPLGALGLQVSLAPLGLTLLLVVVSAETCRYSSRVMSATRRSSGRPVSVRNACQVAALHATVHLVAVVVAASAVSGSGHWGRVLVGGVAIGLLPGLVGALRGVRTPVTTLLPQRVRDVCAGAAAGCAVAVAGGAVALAVGLIGNAARVVELHESLGAGFWGGTVLIILQLGWLPNLIVWWSSWTLGPGFQIGSGTSVSPFGVHLGMVPSVPVLGALPTTGEPGGLVRLWLLVPVLAGVIAALVTSRRRSDDGPAAALLLPTSAGLGAALALGLLGALSGGGIGSGRLAAMGALMPAMPAMALALVGGSALVTGGLVVLLRWWRVRPHGPGDDGARAAAVDGPAAGDPIAGRTDPDPEAAEATRKVSDS